MAEVQNFHDDRRLALPVATFDITAVTAERIFGDLHYYSFNTHGTMFVLHTSGTTILGWSQYDANVVVQTASSDLALQPVQHQGHCRLPLGRRSAHRLA